MTGAATEQPTLFIPHGGGPCFFMPDPAGNWTAMAAFLRSLPAILPARPSAILIVSGHWETGGFGLTSSVRPPLIFDFNGFPPETYQLAYPVAGSPDLARAAADLLTVAGLAAELDAARGLDHGVFVPLKVAFPLADIPVVEMSVDRSLDPALHLAAGRALAPLRKDGVVIIGSGMSYHNMRGYGDPRATGSSVAFDAWLGHAVGLDPAARSAMLVDWLSAPASRLSHPREEHLIPLMVAAGASGQRGERIFHAEVLKTCISAYRFD
jgi:aromatic ring-opening dioxygenase catalytic subunit (LigB family)